MDNKESVFISTIRNIYRGYGLRFLLCLSLMVILIVLLVGCVLSLLWNTKTKVQVEPIGSYISTLEYDKEISIIKAQSLEGEYSVQSMMEEVFSGINDTTQAINIAQSLSELYKSSKAEKKKLLIPKGAGVTGLKDDSGYTELGNFTIYLWKEKGSYLLFDREYSELHVVMIYDDRYIHAYGQSQLLEFDVVTEIGELRN